VAEEQAEWLQLLGRFVTEEWRLNKANKVTIEMQVTQVMQWLVEGYSRRDIIAKVEELWGNKVRKADELIAAARKQFVEQAENLNRQDLVAESIEKFRHLYHAGLNQRQLAVSIAAQQALLKMVGADTPGKSAK
jgi:CHASE3 domain sensor protein